MIRKEAKWYVGSWSGGFDWPIFVGVDAFAYGKLMLEEGEGLCRWSTVSVCALPGI